MAKVSGKPYHMTSIRVGGVQKSASVDVLLYELFTIKHGGDKQAADTAITEFLKGAFDTLNSRTLRTWLIMQICETSILEKFLRR